MKNTTNENRNNEPEYTIADLFRDNNEKHSGLIRAIKSMVGIIPNYLDVPIIMPEYMK